MCILREFVQSRVVNTNFSWLANSFTGTFDLRYRIQNKKNPGERWVYLSASFFPFWSFIIEICVYWKALSICIMKLKPYLCTSWERVQISRFPRTSCSYFLSFDVKVTNQRIWIHFCIFFNVTFNILKYHFPIFEVGKSLKCLWSMSSKYAELELSTWYVWYE